MIGSASEISLIPVYAAVASALLAGGGAAWFTIKNTNSKIEAEASKAKAEGSVFWQEALEKVEERNSKLWFQMDQLRTSMELKLAKTERDLETAVLERNKLALEARLEREQLNSRIADLEKQVKRLREQLHLQRRDD